MARSPESAAFFNLPHARWVVGVLSMLIAVVGKDSLLGLILAQSRSEIAGLVRDREGDPTAACYKNN
ncbi:MAG TPA: hypothetical protein VG013_25900 [Gemmataceae bacterium]|jgi:hypothetical protein|nr:hypothetical protein [Gemmataceae bacterium]